jgi:hypothetical protein
MISDKSNIAKGENMQIFGIIPLEHQWAHPYCKSVEGVWDNVLVNKDMISWMQIGLRKISTDVKGTEMIEITYYAVTVF